MSSVCLICESDTAQPALPAILYPGKTAEIVGCQRCGAAYYWPVPAPEEIAQCYPHAYFRDFFAQYWKDVYKGRVLGERISAWKKTGSFLDVGCALGTLLVGVRQRSAWSVTGLEYMPYAAQLGSQLNQVAIATGGLLQAPWPEATFDYIYANNVLEHESDPTAAIRKAAALLKPGGRLHLTTPNGPVDLLPNKILHRKLGRAVVTRHSGHLFFLSRSALTTLLEKAGFRVVSFSNFHFKAALKARGWMPGAFRQFLKTNEASASGSSNAALPSLEEARQWIPSQPNWMAYWLKAQWRRFWKWSGLSVGYDFEIIAERRP